MIIKTLAAGCAVLALSGGAALAQAQDPALGETLSHPADPKNAKTGVPSVDSTRPTGADAGYTMLPNGQVGGAANMEDDPAPWAATKRPADSYARGATQAAAAADAARSGSDASMTGSMDRGMAAGSMTVQTVTNGPVPDTPENRAQYGGPNSRAGRMTSPSGN